MGDVVDNRRFPRASLPDATLLPARYRQQDYWWRIEGDQWLDQDGRAFASAFATAAAITGTDVNGLRFWEARRLTDSEWRRLDLLRDR